MSQSTAEVAERYASAFLGVIAEAGAIGQAQEGFMRLEAALGVSAELREALMNPLVDGEAKIRILKDVSGDHTAPFAAFMALLSEKRRLVDLAQVVEAFLRLADESQGVLETRVESAVPLTDGERQSLIGALEERFHKKIRMRERIVPEVLGGLRVVLDDEVLDLSLSTRLRRLGQMLRTEDAKKVGDQA